MSVLSSLLERIRRHWNDPGSRDRRIVTGFLWVALFVFIGKLAGAAKEVAIAWRYGVSDTVDAYSFVFNLVTWPIPVWFGLLSAVLVPIVSRMRYEAPEQLKRFRAELLTITALLGIVGFLVAFFLLPMFLESSLAGLSPGTRAEALKMVRPLSWILPLGAVISLFSAWTMALGRHRNTLLEAIPASAILIFLLMPAGSVANPLIWGTVMGYLLHVVLLAWPLGRTGELSPPLLTMDATAWPGFWHGLRVLVLGYALMSLTTLIDQFFAAHLETGAIATVNYANRIMALILSLGALAINRATLPVFSEAAAHGQLDHLAKRWARWMLIGGAAVPIALWPLAHWMVRLIFQRGAFSEANTAQVAEILQLFLLQVPFYFYGLVLVAALTSRKDYFAVALSGIIGVLSRLLVNAILVPRMGIDGIAVSAAVGYAATSMYMAIRMRTR